MKTILIIDDDKRWSDIIPHATIDAEEIEAGKALVVYARTYWDAIFYLRTYKGLFFYVYIDFQLSYNPDDETGMDVLLWLEQNPEFIPASLDSCSGNPANKMTMWKKIQELMKIKETV